MASLILLAVLTMYCIWSLRRIIKHAKKIAESVPVALIKALECADKGYFFPSSRTFYPNGRMCFQSVDEASSTKYDEDTIKQRFNCSDNRRKLREEFSKMKKTYKIEVDCANCANLMEDAARKTSGVQSATVNFMTQKMIVEFAEGQEPASVMDAVQKACKKVEPDCEIFL